MYFQTIIVLFTHFTPLQRINMYQFMFKKNDALCLVGIKWHQRLKMT